MSIDLVKVLSKEQLGKLSESEIASISESINVYMKEQKQILESETTAKFDKLVEGLTEKFEAQVNNVIIESTKTGATSLINDKMYNIVRDIANVLESAGIPTTEKTKELQGKLSTVKTELKEKFAEMEEMQEELKVAQKENFIHSQLKGLNPEIISSALDYFKDKDILDVQDGLQNFIDGDFSDLDLDNREDDITGDIDLDQVSQALDQMDSDMTEKEGREAKLMNSNKKIFESLGTGLNRNKAMSPNPNISKEDLDDASRKSLNESQETDMDDDVSESMKNIDNFNDLGLFYN